VRTAATLTGGDGPLGSDLTEIASPQNPTLVSNTPMSTKSHPSKAAQSNNRPGVSTVLAVGNSEVSVEHLRELIEHLFDEQALEFVFVEDTPLTNALNNLAADSPSYSGTYSNKIPPTPALAVPFADYVFILRDEWPDALEDPYEEWERVGESNLSETRVKSYVAH